MLDIKYFQKDLHKQVDIKNLIQKVLHYRNNFSNKTKVFLFPFVLHPKTFKVHLLNCSVKDIKLSVKANSPCTESFILQEWILHEVRNFFECSYRCPCKTTVTTKGFVELLTENKPQKIKPDQGCFLWSASYLHSPTFSL